MDSTTRFNQRLLTEAVRQLEALRGTPFEEPAAQAAGRSATGDLEQRLIARAENLHCVPALQSALQQLRQMLGFSIGLLLLLALLAGAGAARLAFGVESEQPLNIYWLLAVILALPSLTLLLWLLLLLVPRSTGSNSLGALVFTLGRWLGNRLHPGDDMLRATSRARARLLLHGGGYWQFGALSHALWLAYLTGALIMTLILLSIRQYGFVWETTILSADTYIALTRTLALIPDRLGFPTPDAGQIVASRWQEGPAPVTDAAVWSGFIVACLIVYGLLPRLLLVPCCLLMYRRARDRFRLDTDLPGFARLQDELQPLSKSLGVVDPNTEPPATATIAARPTIVALETEPPEEWPPALGHDWLDLGLIDDRASRARVLEQLTATSPPPDTVAGTLVVVCSLAMTPDRGIGRTIEQLASVAPCPLLLLLTDGQRLRQRETRADIIQRIADWHRLAAQAGISEENVLELDLYHLTETSRAGLAERLGLNYRPAPAHGSRIDAACELILNHVENRNRSPDAAERAELQRAIARLYGNRRDAFKLPLPNPDPTQGSVRQQLQHGAEWVRQLLPPRLRANPRWLATGALSGALGCVALATLTAPAALAALPLWSGMGAALTLFMTPQNTHSAPNQPLELGEPVAAAALFMLLLELQGRPEAEITAALDQLLDTETPSIQNAAEARSWLDTLRERYTRWQEQTGS